MNKQRKGGDGRKRIKIEKIKDKSRLQVTFSKRRKGLFKKATELSVLTCAQVALIAFSPAGKPYVCGNTDLLLDRFVNGEASEIHQKDHDDPEQRRYMEVEQELEAEKKRGVFLDSLINSDLRGGNDNFWWNTYVDGLSLDELKQMKSDMEQLQKCVAQRSNDLKMTANTASSSSSSSYEDNPLALMKLPAGNDDIVDDDHLNKEMVNELVFDFDSQEYDFGTTTSTDQEITADMFSDDYYY
ncbi:hypothetical protein MKW98_029665 [Papaver atlanticum]|uniref:MADS-box domain-containing protein n=1 Tax=Papaver atlanticum TaxID=357466 RepID=A0AAD4T6E3_9MAGN|nr:hypothetical protein MKW98_029665 [Papaver atlanticum]